MARSTSVPFRREYSVSSSGYLETSEGSFVGDIPAIRIYVEGSLNVSILIEGRTSRTGNWERLASFSKKNSSNSIDIRQYEYIRVDASLINGASNTRIVIFGYDLDSIDLPQQIKVNDNDFRILLENNQCLKDIKTILKTINDHLSIITGENL
jgi:hypothetical protein